MLKRYRYHLQAAHEAGERGHPEAVIRRLAPKAVDLEPHVIGDCWLFNAPEIVPLPPYLTELKPC